jgi:hypothetical protein
MDGWRVEDDRWLFVVRRVEVILGLLLAAVSLAPWWTHRADGRGASAWTGPHLSWLAVALCLALVAGRSLLQPGPSDRWAVTGAIVALAVAGWGPLAELAGIGITPDDGPPRMAWVLRDQGPNAGLLSSPFGIAWGYPAGLCLMGLLLATFAIAARLRRP